MGCAFPLDADDRYREACVIGYASYNKDMSEALDTDILRRVGEALYGPQWQTPLARSLGVAPRHLRYWLSGERPLPRDILERVTARIVDRCSELIRLHCDLAEIKSGGLKKPLDRAPSQSYL